MASTIPYLIFLGIIFVTNGTPDNRENSQHEEPSQYFKQLMKEFLTQGNYDVLLNHHEDRKGAHHEDTSQLTYKGNKLSNRYYKNPYRNVESHQVVDGNNLNYKHLLNLLSSKRPRNQKTVDDDDNIIDKMSWNANPESNYEDHSNEIKGFLNNLDNKLSLNSGNSYEVVCYGEGCGFKQNEDKLNSNGDHYRSRNRNDNNRNNRDIQCGNRCSRKANDLGENMFTKDINHILRLSNNKDDKRNGDGGDRNYRGVKDDDKSDKNGYREDERSDDHNRYDSYDNNRYGSDNGNMEYRDDSRDVINNTNDNKIDMNDNRNYINDFHCPGNTCVRGGIATKEETLLFVNELAIGIERLLKVLMNKIEKTEAQKDKELMDESKHWVSEVRDEIMDHVNEHFTKSVIIPLRQDLFWKED